MLPLYEIDIELQFIMDSINEYASEHEGEYPDWMNDKLNELNQDKQTKIGNICRLIKTLKSEGDAVKKEADILTKRAKSSLNKVKRLKEYLSCYIPKGEKFQDNNSKISWRKSPSVFIPDEFKYKDAPEKWVNTKETWNKIEIKKAINDNSKVVPEGIIIVTNQNIQIK